MSQSLPPFWELIGFADRLATWIQREQPGADLIGSVTSWIERRADNPYTGVRRYTDVAANLWWGRVSGTYRDGADVCCSYWIDEELRQIRCDSIATIARPNL